MRNATSAAGPEAALKVPGKSNRKFDPTQLLTATEKALASVPAEASTSSGRFLDELHRPTGGLVSGGRATKRDWSPEIFRDGRTIPHSDKLVAKVVQVSVAPDVLEKLKGYQTLMREVYDDTAKHSSKAAHERFQEQAGELTERVLAGDSPTGEITLRSRQAVQDEFRARQKAYVSRLVKLTGEYMMLTAPLLDQARKQIESALESREAQDRADCESHGVPFHPSAVWQSLCNLAMRFTNDRLPRPGQWEFPSRVLAGIVNLEN